MRACSAERTGSRSSVGSTTALVCEENATKPTSSLSGTRSRNVCAAERAASSRDGSTSFADIEPDSSVTSITEAFSTGTAAVASGFANATASMRRRGREQRGGQDPPQRAAGGTLASVAAAGKRTA